MDVQKFSITEFDLYLCPLGFEQRCLAAPTRLKQSGIKASRGIYFEPSTNRQDNRANLPELVSRLASFCQTVDSLQADEVEFPDRLQRVVSALKRNAKRTPSVLLDISVLPNRMVMKVAKVLLEADISLSVLYSEASVYHPTREEFDHDPEEWRSDSRLGLERGVMDVAPSREYPGQHLDPLPDCLIVFPSFKSERTKAVIARVDPSLLAVPGGKVIWLIGKPHLHENSWRAQAMRRLNGIPVSAPQSEVSTFDYKDALKRLDMIYAERCEKFNMTVSPLGPSCRILEHHSFVICTQT